MSLDKLKLWLGFGPDCVNGGRKTNYGTCECPKYYAGRVCEHIVCLNRGVRDSSREACVCPDPHIRGAHCEILSCENGGTDNGHGRCSCLEPWYTGPFCEYYSSPWVILFGCVGLAIAVVAFLCIACRLRTCRRRRRRPGGSGGGGGGHHHSPRLYESDVAAQVQGQNRAETEILMSVPSRLPVRYKHFIIKSYPRVPQNCIGSDTFQLASGGHAGVRLSEQSMLPPPPQPPPVIYTVRCETPPPSYEEAIKET